jgi:hypothetical protein
MSKRTAKFVSAIFASLLAGTPFTTASHGATEAADSCPSRPKGAPPQGGHWYYRIDHATKRNCWYLGEEKEKLSRPAPEHSKRPTNSVSSPSSASTRRSIANARAELPPPQTRVDPEIGVFTGRRLPAAAADAKRLEDDQRANAGDIDAQRSVVASRWPEASGAGSSAAPQPPTRNSGAGLQQTSEAAPPPAFATVAAAAADAPSAKPSAPVPQLSIVIVGALSLAGLIASAIFSFGGTRRKRRREVDRRAVWDTPGTDRPSLSDEARAAASMREVNLSRAPRAADDPNDGVAQMLARLARSAAT